jgi:hypothetical protein
VPPLVRGELFQEVAKVSALIPHESPACDPAQARSSAVRLHDHRLVHGPATPALPFTDGIVAPQAGVLVALG